MKAGGLVAQGVLTSADLLGPLKVDPKGMSVLADQMEKGWTYVSLHVFQDLGAGRRFCCPEVLLGVIWPSSP